MQTPTPQNLLEAFKTIELILNVPLDRRQLTISVGSINPSWTIFHDEHELKTLFYDLVTLFADTWLGNRSRARRGTLHITFKAEENHIAVQITMRHMPLTSIQWGVFFNRFQELACYEYLREIGGDIAPLTQDEGHGQGVIVRLPWAT